MLRAKSIKCSDLNEVDWLVDWLVGLIFYGMSTLWGLFHA